MAGAFLAPFLYALYSRKVTAASCWTCFILAPVFTLVGVFCRDAMPGVILSHNAPNYLTKVRQKYF